MEKREAAIVAAYTGVLVGEFSDMHEYIEEIMERPVFTHEMGDEAVGEEIKARSRNDFISIHISPEPPKVLAGNMRDLFMICPGRDVEKWWNDNLPVTATLTERKGENKED